jgi:hypothetical protein
VQEGKAVTAPAFLRRSAGLVALGLELVSQGAGAQLTAPASGSVLDSVRTRKVPERSFLPKYSPEWFVGAGYSGTFMSTTRQWPTLVVAGEGLFARPGKVDFGAYVEARLGRPDAEMGAFDVGAGAEIMWRLLERAMYDVAPVVRGTYLFDTAHPDNPLIRASAGLQVSILRSFAVLATYDPLFSLDQAFSNGDHFASGFSLTAKFGLCMLTECRQARQRSTKTIDRSAVTCRDAAMVCDAAKKAAGGMDAKLCSAAQGALDSSQHPAAWGDPVGAFLETLANTESPDVKAVTESALQKLRVDHTASMQGIDDYAERLRHLGTDEALSATYAYLVTPSMVRDWFGCDVAGKPVACASGDVCVSDTGVAAE